MKISTRDRKKSYRVEVCELLPYVRQLHHPKPCEGYRWNKMPLKAVFGKDAAELKEQYRCSKNAHWSYKFRPGSKLTRSHNAGKTMRFCWAHMPFDRMDEYERMLKWFNAHEDEVDAIRAKHGLCSMAEARIRVEAENRMEASDAG